MERVGVLLGLGNRYGFTAVRVRIVHLEYEYYTGARIIRRLTRVVASSGGSVYTYILIKIYIRNNILHLNYLHIVSHFQHRMRSRRSRLVLHVVNQLLLYKHAISQLEKPCLSKPSYEPLKRNLEPTSTRKSRGTNQNARFF